MITGRPTEYDSTYVDKAKEYLTSCIDVQVDEKTLKVKLPTIEWLALYLWINRDTVYDWKGKYAEFSDIIATVLHKQAEWLINNGLSWAYNPTIAKVLLTKHWYTDKIETDNRNNNLNTDTHDLSDEQKKLIAQRWTTN